MMRCTIAGHSFYLQPAQVEQSMAGCEPESIAGACAFIGSHWYPVKQVGAVLTGQDRRDFTVGEVVRALQRLGFPCLPTSPEA